MISADGSPAVLVEENVLFNGSLVNAGRIDGAVSLASGDFELLDTSVLALDISSETDFEAIDIAGNLIFDGTLELNFLNPLEFEIGQTIDLFDFGLASGTFDNVFAGPLSLDLSNLASFGTVTVAASAVPEPSAFVVLALGGLATLRRRRK